jgi:hypothetical protein
MAPPEEEEPFFIGEHYLYDGFWYYHKFPVEWAKNHRDDSGPKNCANCAGYGTLHNGSIFIGYCVNCATKVYDLKRGPGFDGVVVTETPSYLFGVDLQNIPPLLCDVSPPPEENEQQQQQRELSILDCHFEGGYNDF